MSEISRRRLFKLGATAATAGAAASLLPPSVQAALARPPGPGGLRALRHVVFLMQENRSFDHYFGTLRGVRGFADPNAITLRGGGTVYAQPKGAGTVLPFSVREAAKAAKQDPQFINDLDHSWKGGQQASAGGWHDGWIGAKSPATMAYYDRRDLPFHYELADTFTICDAYHCAVPSSTSPNRNYLMSGYTGWEPDGVHRAVGNDGYDEDHHAGYSWTTYAEQLEAAGRHWKVYQEWDNYQDNNLELFVRFKEIARKALGGSFRSFDSFYSAVFRATPDGRAALFAQLADGVAKLTPDERRLYEKAQRRVEPGKLVDDLRADIAADRLPEVSYLVPSAADSEHPSASSPAASATLTYQVLDALASDPDVWESTALFLTYDENDGFFDHVPPPRPPDGVSDEFYEGHPIGLGTRVPMIVVSPWTVGGYACSQVFDHSSLVRFVETWLGVPAPQISAWRRTVSGDLTSAFDFRRQRRRSPAAGARPRPTRGSSPSRRPAGAGPGRCRTSRTRGSTPAACTSRTRARAAPTW
jgi:phospholipase C